LSSTTQREARLSAGGLCCIRGDQLIFDDLDFDARAGQIWQITGPNGAGKTSLLRLLAGLANPAGGSLQWRGAALPAARDQLQQDLLFLGHLPAISGFMTAAENLRYARALCASPNARDIDDVLRQLGLPDAATTLGQRLSAGQRQRLALARFLLAEAALWIMDEPLTALDAHGRQAVEAMLEAHAAAGGIAIVSTHQALALPPGMLHQFQLGTAAR